MLRCFGGKSRERICSNGLFVVTWLVFTIKLQVIFKRFRITSESYIVFLFSVLSLLLFFMIPDRPLPSRISETAILSVTKLHTHVGVCLLSCTWYFLRQSELPFWIWSQIRILRFSSISPKLIMRSSFPVSLIVDLDKCYLSSFWPKRSRKLMRTLWLKNLNFDSFWHITFFFTVKPELCLHHIVELLQCYISCSHC